ncbi:MAG: hypothetical protein EZS28_012643 [Streblomastix strix]|uniref:Protein kinase domain-containing protein n=1 Tax=Streblomastix strix TaxID=222440 RepID=A0A5J4WA78_9EUKA|nr:MAG: hypothetical protein EZS28_012643 [Streblomastix strix]
MYQSQDDVIIVMEFVNMSGLDAFEKKSEACGLPLTIVRKMMWQILEGIYEMHNVKMIHRDLKDKNILMNWNLNVLDNTSPKGFRYASNEQEDMNCEVSMKIADFGLAGRFEGNKMTQKYYGPPLNMAPEVFDDQRAYDAKSDIWSAGIVFYQLCTSKFPFPAKYIQEMKNMVQRPFDSVKIHPQQQQLPNIQQQYIQLNDLLQKMLCIYPQQRITALAALYHGFFTDEAVNNGRMTLEKYDWNLMKQEMTLRFSEIVPFLSQMHIQKFKDTRMLMKNQLAMQQQQQQLQTNVQAHFIPVQPSLSQINREYVLPGESGFLSIKLIILHFNQLKILINKTIITILNTIQLLLIQTGHLVFPSNNLKKQSRKIMKNKKEVEKKKKKLVQKKEELKMKEIRNQLKIKEFKERKKKKY